MIGAKKPLQDTNMSYNSGFHNGADSYRPSGSSRSQQSSRSPFYQDRGSNYRPSGGPRGGGFSRHPPSRAPQRHPGAHSVYQQVNNQTQNQLWMGDLDPSWDERAIMDAWINAGEHPSSVKIIRDKAGVAQYCFVHFPSQRDVANAIKKNRSPVPGSQRLFKLNWASGSGPPPSDPQSRHHHGGRGQVDYSIFVGDIAADITDAALYSRFDMDYPGAVRQVKIMTDPHTKMSKGFGFVRFTNPDAQSHALKNMSGVMLGDRPIRVGPANGGGSGGMLGPGGSETGGPRRPTDAHKPATSTVKLNQYHPLLGPFTDPNNTVIAVRGVSPDISRDDLLAHFLPFGHIVYCRVDYKKKIARIKFLCRVSAQRAMHFMYGFPINDNPVSLRWGREETTNVGKVRFFPTDKSSKYVAALKEPKGMMQLQENVVFEDLTREQVDQLTAAPKVPSVEDLDREHDTRIQARDDYLALAF